MLPGRKGDGGGGNTTPGGKLRRLRYAIGNRLKLRGSSSVYKYSSLQRHTTYADSRNSSDQIRISVCLSPRPLRLEEAYDWGGIHSVKLIISEILADISNVNFVLPVTSCALPVALGYWRQVRKKRPQELS